MTIWRKLRTPPSPFRNAATRRSKKLPAGIDSDSGPSIRERSRLRKRLRYLQQLREFQLRDLGGYLFEAQRKTGLDSLTRYRSVISEKLKRISATDQEIQSLRNALALTNSSDLRYVPGVGGLCKQCEEPFSSEARFCSNCGGAVSAKTVQSRRKVMPADDHASTPQITFGTASTTKKPDKIADPTQPDE